MTVWLALPLAAGVIGVGAISLVGTDEEGTASRSALQPSGSVVGSGQIRYDGGPDEGSRGPAAIGVPTDGARYDAGPEEGTRGLR
jgi:hypothetical protein